METPKSKLPGKPLASRILTLLNHPAFVCGLLGVLVTVVYWPATRADFINYDDNEYVTSNPHVLGGLTLANAAWALTTGHAGNWHPLTWWSHMLDTTLFGPGPAGPHAVNILLHAINSMLVFRLFRGLTSAHWRSALLAGFFALHPLHVESVAWVAERKDVLSTLFALLALLAYGRHARSAAGWKPEAATSVQAPDSRRRDRNLWLALLFFTLGLASKPMVVTLPFVMLLLDYWPLGRFNPATRATLLRLVREKFPFFILSAGVCVITFLVQQRGGAVGSLADLPFTARVVNALVAYTRYLGKTFWPVKLALPYPHPGHWPAGMVIGAAMLVGGLFFLAVKLRRRFPFVFTGWFWFAGTLIPVIGLVQVGIQSLADRYAYVPLIGVLLVIVWGGGQFTRRFPQAKTLAIGVAVAALGACALRTADQLRYWQNSETLFRHALAVTENNFLAYDNLGFYLFEKGDLTAALENYHHALEINATDPNTLNNLGSALVQQKKYPEAITSYQAALRARPNFAEAHNNLGVALDATGRGDEAATNYAAALMLDPENAQALNNLAKIRFAEGQQDLAARFFRRAVALNPDFPEALNNLGWTLASLGKFDEAEDCFARLLKLHPTDAAARVNYGRVLASNRKWSEAGAQFSEALRLDPDSIEAKQELQKLEERLQKSP